MNERRRHRRAPLIVPVLLLQGALCACPALAAAEGAINLEHALGIAINASFELRAVRARAGILDLAVQERWRDYFPSLTLSYLQTEERRAREGDSRQHRLQAASEITVYDGGRRGIEYDVARLEKILASNDYRIGLNRLIAEVSSSFFDLMRARDEIAIHRATLEQGRTQLGFITREHDLGEATKLDMLAIRAKVREVELALEKAVEDYEVRKNRFKTLLKLDWRTPIEPEGDIERDFAFFPPPPHLNPDFLVGAALKNRREAHSADVECLISARRHLMSRRYYYPKLSLGLNYSLSNNDERAVPRERGWGVNFRVSTAFLGSGLSAGAGYSRDNNGNSTAYSGDSSLGVLDGMSYRRSIAETASAAGLAVDRKKSVRQQIAAEIAALYASLNHTWKMIGTSAERLELYDSFLAIERLKAGMGESRRYDLVKKEIERGEAAIARLDSLIRYCVTASALESAAGVDIGSFRLALPRARLAGEKTRMKNTMKEASP